MVLSSEWWPESGRAKTRPLHAHAPAPRGTRGRTHGNAAAVTVAFLFHPDYDRRPWNRTRSADPAHRPGCAGARGLSRRIATTAGGDFHPALRTLPALRADPAIVRSRDSPRAT